MTTQPPELSNNSHQHSQETNLREFFDAISACIYKAEALVMVATTADFEIYSPDITSNYLWALSDIICNAKKLYEKAIKCEN